MEDVAPLMFCGQGRDGWLDTDVAMRVLSRKYGAREHHVTKQGQISLRKRQVNNQRAVKNHLTMVKQGREEYLSLKHLVTLSLTTDGARRRRSRRSPDAASDCCSEPSYACAKAQDESKHTPSKDPSSAYQYSSLRCTLVAEVDTS